MALFDFFRRRRPAADSSRPRGSGGITGFLNRIFGRRKPEPEPIYPEEEEPEPEPEADIIIDDDYIESLDDNIVFNDSNTDLYTDEPEPFPDLVVNADVVITESTVQEFQITQVSDAELLEKYGKMLDTMVQRGYINSFDNDADAAEFLRVLSSQAWEEAHGYWYSVEALSQIQDAVARGAKAGTLQSNYNLQIEKKSNNYLKTWEEWMQ